MCTQLPLYRIVVVPIFRCTHFRLYTVTPVHIFVLLNWRTLELQLYRVVVVPSRRCTEFLLHRVDTTRCTEMSLYPASFVTRRQINNLFALYLAIVVPTCCGTKLSLDRVQVLKSNKNKNNKNNNKINKVDTAST